MFKKSVPKFFEKENCLLNYENLQLFETRIQTKKINWVLGFNQSQWLKPYIEFNPQKRIEAEKNVGKAGSVTLGCVVGGMAPPHFFA